MEAVWGMQGVGCSLEESGCSWFPMTRPLVSARARRPGVHGSVSTDQGAMDGSGVAGVNWTVTKRSLSVYDSSVLTDREGFSDLWDSDQFDEVDSAIAKQRF